MQAEVASATTPLIDLCQTRAVCRLAVIWIDWYPYHIARFRGLCAHPAFSGAAAGIELVGGTGVHPGLVFRESDREDLPIETLLPDVDWNHAGQVRMAKLVWKQLNRLQPQAVLVPGYYTLPAIAAAIWANLHGRRCILMTESTREDHARGSIREFAKSTLIRGLFHSAIVGGEPHARYLKLLGVKSDRITTGYDVVDNDFFREGTDGIRATGKPDDLPGQYFLFVGRLAEEKNVAGLIEAFSRFVQSGGTSDLVLAGDGPLKKQLQQQAADTGCGSRVHFVGMKTARELLPYYAFAQCFVLPSSREPWGLVVNEAMAAGLPVLVSKRCGCAEDLVHPGNGFVFEPDDAAGLEQLLLRVAAMDGLALQRMGQRSREIIARYSPEHWARQVERTLTA